MKRPAGSSPTRTGATSTSATACPGSSTSARNSGRRTIWSAGSRPCSTTTTRTPLQDWLDDLAHSGLAPLAGLAGALREDRHAVAQGITTAGGHCDSAASAFNPRPGMIFGYENLARAVKVHSPVRGYVLTLVPLGGSVACPGLLRAVTERPTPLVVPSSRSSRFGGLTLPYWGHWGMGRPFRARQVG